MGTRGRRSEASLGVVQVVSTDRPEPPVGLEPGEALLWRDIVQSLAADYFRPADFPVLVAYCQTIAQYASATEELRGEPLTLVAPSGRRYANPLLAVQQQAAMRMASLAVKLRLCPSARYGARKAFGAGRSAGAKPWQHDAHE